MGRGPIALALFLLGLVGLETRPAPADVNCNVGVDFYPGGPLRSCNLNGHHRLYTAQGQALTCANGHVLVQYENGRLKSCVLAQPLTSGGLTCEAGRRVDFEPDGTLARCRPGADGSEDAPVWHYTLGRERAGQQANLCRHLEVIREVAGVFRQEGPRAGYAALDRARGCGRRVESFTPRAVLDTVPIPAGEGGDYTVSFVEVTTVAGAVEYLVTTRDVRP